MFATLHQLLLKYSLHSPLTSHLLTVLHENHKGVFVSLIKAFPHHQFLNLCSQTRLMAAPEPSLSRLEVCLPCGLHTNVTVSVKWNLTSASHTPTGACHTFLWWEMAKLERTVVTELKPPMLPPSQQQWCSFLHLMPMSRAEPVDKVEFFLCSFC